jgi:hypothetical protein
VARGCRAICVARCRSAVRAVPDGYRVFDANGLGMAHVYCEPPNAIAAGEEAFARRQAGRLRTRQRVGRDDRAGVVLYGVGVRRVGSARFSVEVGFVPLKWRIVTKWFKT